MRLEAPPERITAASMSFFLRRLFLSVLGLVPRAVVYERRNSFPPLQKLKTGAACCATTKENSVGAYGLARLDFYLFVRGVLRAPAHGDQLGDYTDGDFFRR